MHRYYEALSLELLVILAATFLLIWIHQEGVVRCKRFGQVIGYIVLLISILMMGCTLYNAIWGKKRFSVDMQHRPQMQFGPGQQRGPGKKRRDRPNNQFQNQPGSQQNRPGGQQDKPPFEDKNFPPGDQ